MKNRLKKMRIGRNTGLFLLEAFVAIALFYVLSFVFSPVGPLSMFPAAFLLIMIGVGILMYLSRIHMGGYTMAKALKEQNLSYAIILLSYAIIIAAVLSKI